MIDKNIPVTHLMTTDVISLKPNNTVNKIADIFRSNNIHHIPVIDEDNKVIGMVSKSDFLKLQHGMTLFKKKDAEAFNSALYRSLLVKEVMIDKIVKLSESDTIEIALGIFRENLFHAMPVVDDEGVLVGILSTFDLLTYAYLDPVFID